MSKENETSDKAQNGNDFIADASGWLHCPFCGSDCEFETTTFGDCMTDYFRVSCKEGGHALDWWEDTKEEAIVVWNERQ